MSLTGTLDDFSPVEIISVLDVLQRSGKLRLTHGEEEGMVVFRSGKIIYAASSGCRENLGTMLMARGLVDEGQLVEALGRQIAANEEKRLGTILIEMGALSQENLNEVILEQVIQTVAQFGHWDSGDFDFNSVHIADHGEVELKSGELWAPLGFSPNHVLLRLAQAMDESQAEAPLSPVEPKEPESETPVPDEPASLNDFVGDLRGPQVKGELIQELLEQATQVFGRCLVFSVRQDGFRSIAQTGQCIPQPANGSQLIEVALGRDVPSLLSRCEPSGHTVMARLPEDPGDHEIVDALGGPVNDESVAMPLAVRGGTVLILYGDSLLQELPPAWAENLEGLLSESGQKIEAEIEAEIAAEIAAVQPV